MSNNTAAIVGRSNIVQVCQDLIPAPAFSETLGNGKRVSLDQHCIIHKTGRSSLPSTDKRLRADHRIKDRIVSTHMPWTGEIARVFRYVGTRIFFLETDPHQLNQNGKDVKIKIGGIIRAGITIAEPTQGYYIDDAGTGREPAMFVECLIIAESLDQPVRFSDIYEWNNRQFAGTFLAHPKNCTSDAPMAVWEEYVERFEIKGSPCIKPM